MASVSIDLAARDIATHLQGVAPDLIRQTTRSAIRHICEKLDLLQHKQIVNRQYADRNGNIVDEDDYDPLSYYIYQIAHPEYDFDQIVTVEEDRQGEFLPATFWNDVHLQDGVSTIRIKRSDVVTPETVRVTFSIKPVNDADEMPKILYDRASIAIRFYGVFVLAEYAKANRNWLGLADNEIERLKIQQMGSLPSGVNSMLSTDGNATASGRPGW